VAYESVGAIDYRLILSHDSTFASDTIRYGTLHAPWVRPYDQRIPLPDDQVFYWKVRVEMGDTVVSPWSATGSFQIAPSAVARVAAPDLYSRVLAARVADQHGQVAVTYSVTVAGQYRLRVYSLTGTLVQALLDTRLEPGIGQVIWNRRDSRGRPVSPGRYLVTLASDSREWTTPVLLP